MPDGGAGEKNFALDSKNAFREASLQTIRWGFDLLYMKQEFQLKLHLLPHRIFSLFFLSRYRR